MSLTRPNVLQHLRGIIQAEGLSFVRASEICRVHESDFQPGPDTRGRWRMGWEKMLRCFDLLGYEVTFSIRKKE